jgi:hypothetical protein
MPLSQENIGKKSPTPVVRLILAFGFFALKKINRLKL